MRLPIPNKFSVLLLLALTAIGIFTLRSKEASANLPSAPRTANMNTLPAVIIWAWERPESLRFLDSNKVGVAFLAKTIQLRGDSIDTRPRLQPLDLAEGTQRVAVVRIESSRTDRPHLTLSQLKAVASEIAELSSLPSLAALQIDFDATLSQREFYRQLLFSVRQKLPPNLPLSITALASWCAGDHWLSELPIDEAVPMLFRLGAEQHQFQTRLDAGDNFKNTPCQNAAGVSTDELVKPPVVQRLYIFNPNSWSQSSLTTAMEIYKR
jgi:hypothetical protein